MAHQYNRRCFISPALWVDCAGGMVPPNSPIIGGNDVNGEPLYVGRAVQDGDTIPGKVVPSHRVCYVPYGGKEKKHHTYQVLCNPNQSHLAWVPASAGQVPSGALLGGEQSDGTPLYIGRAYYKHSLVIGKVQPRHNVLYVSYAGDEIKISSYEVLVVKDVHTSPY